MSFWEYNLPINFSLGQIGQPNEVKFDLEQIWKSKILDKYWTFLISFIYMRWWRSSNKFIEDGGYRCFLRSTSKPRNLKKLDYFAGFICNAYFVSIFILTFSELLKI